MSDYKNYLLEAASICEALKVTELESFAQELIALKKRDGRLFMLGVGGSAANCSHAVNDFRKLCNIEAYAPTDNVSELTARTNDEGWNTVFSGWLQGSKLCDKDMVFIFSVGGGDLERNLSVNLIEAIDLAKVRGARVLSIVGRPGSYAHTHADNSIVIPVKAGNYTTPLAESFQVLIWHALVSDKRLQEHETVW